jgi:hydrogenase nickel incorporation protein HypA/HybF
MHELSLASSFIELAEQEAGKAGSTVILSVKVNIGYLSGVDVEAFRFALDISRKGTLLENARIEMELLPGRGTCRTCGAVFPVETEIAACPVCTGTSVTISGGTEFRIVSLEIE